MKEFWDSEANKFTLYGAIFGFLFPVIATIIEAVQLGGLTVANMVEVQRTDPLLWIIDSAPFFLGLFARFAGWRQDQLKKIIRRNIPLAEEVQENYEDSRQFAGVLTFLAGGLISVVLFLVIFWLQSLITTTLTQLPTTTPNSDIVVNGNQSGQAAPAPVVSTATPLAPTPAVIVIAQDPPTPTAVVTSEVAGELVDTTTTAGNQELATPPLAESPTATAPPTAAPLPTNLIRLGVLERGELDCIPPSDITVAAWQELLGIDVVVEEFSTTDDLFSALTDPDNTQHVDVTLCYVDPIDRSYLRQYSGALKVLGKAVVEEADAKLLTMQSGAPMFLGEEKATCVDNQLRNQAYDLAEISDVDPVEWVAVNQELIQLWMDCPLLQ
ncbi:MAG: hypothetical protein KDE19_02095 [Caldilineaceae bacterium]|nr:hypothetical protein [Caldilineaceae bacterium]